jgi:hypothetical protein
MFRAGSAVLLLVAVSAAGAGAQSHTQGLFLKVHGNASTLSMEDSNTTDMGGGIGFGIGYGFTAAIAGFINVDAAAMSGDRGDPDYTLGHAELGGRYTFRDASARWRPSLDASVAVRMAWWENLEIEGLGPVDMELTGFAYGLGGGLAYFFNPSLALNMGLRVNVGLFDELKVDKITVDLEGDERIKATTSRFNLGVVWYPSGRSVLALQH